MMHVLPRTSCPGPRPTRRRSRTVVALLIAIWQPTILGAAREAARSRIPGRPAGELLALADEPVADPAAERQKLIAELGEKGVQCEPVAGSNGAAVPGKLRVVIDVTKASDATMALLERLSGIEELMLGPNQQQEPSSPIEFTEASFDSIVKLTNLKNLTLWHLTIPESAIEKLASLPNLSQLGIYKCGGITDDTLRQLKNFRALHDLDLTTRANQITVKGFRHLAAIPSLKELKLFGVAVTDEDLRCLAESPSLEFLQLFGQTFSDEGMRTIAGMKNLRGLQLIDSKVTADGLRHLKAAAAFESLDLHHCTQLFDDSLIVIGELSHLRRLLLNGIPVTDEGLGHLKALVDLQLLDVQSHRFTGEGLASLTALVKLRKLSIHGENVSDGVFAHLHQFPKLRELVVGAGIETDHPKISDAGLKLIAEEAPNLRWIYLVGTAVTEQGLESLEALPKLDLVNITWSPGVTKQSWQPAARRQKLAAERDPPEAAEGQPGPPAEAELAPGDPGAGDPAARKKLIAELAEMGVQCQDVRNSRNGKTEPGKLTVEIKGPKASDATLAMLEHLSGIEELTLSPGPFTDTGFHSVAQLKDLRRLTLRGISIPPSGIEKLGELPQLRWIEIHDCDGLTDETLGQLKNIRPLEKLFLISRANNATVQSVAQLPSIPSLKRLVIRNIAISDESIKLLGECQSLEFLALGGPAFSDEGLRTIGAMKRLHTLYLDGSNVTAEGLRHLKAARGLETLGLRKCPHLDNDSLAAVGELSQLGDLKLSDLPTTDEGLAHLNRLVHLTNLSLKNCGLTGAGLASLTALDELTDLDIEGDQVSNALFAHLHQFPALGRLVAGAGHETQHPGITDEGLKGIGNVPNLESINFLGTGITDQGLESLDALPRLDWVSIGWSPGVTKPSWQPSARRKQSAARHVLPKAAALGPHGQPAGELLALAEQSAGDPAAERKKLIAELAEMGVECREFKHPDYLSPDPGMLTVEIKAGKTSDAMLSMLERLNGVQHLILGPGPGKDNQLTDTHFYLIAQLKGLKYLSLLKIGVSPAGIGKLAELPKLQWIEISACEGVNDETFRQLATCRGLETLHFYPADSRVTANGVAHLASLRALKYLQILDVDDQGLQNLARSDSLEILMLSGSLYSDEGLRSVAHIKNLRLLILAKSNKISGEGLGHLKSARRLNWLEVVGCPRVDDDALVAVGELSNLGHLTIWDLPITDAGLVPLNRLVKLYDLCICSSRWTGAGLASLNALKSLTNLRILGPKLSDDIFPHLHQFPSLVVLQTGADFGPESAPGITNDGLKLIGDMPKLATISFCRTSITNQGRESLPALPRLRSVWLSRPSGGTEQWTFKPGE